MDALLEQLAGKLIVSCQPVIGGAMDRPEIVAAYALAALDGGAAALRIEGIANVRAVRRVCQAPIVGLIKRDLADSPVRITPFVDDVRQLAQAGANIIAFDATQRPRPAPVADLVAAVHANGALAMADCSVIGDAINAAALGVAIVSSTLSGYTDGPVPESPDLVLVSELAALGPFVVAEGRYHTPAQAALAMRAGASAIVIGSAITRPEHITAWFAQAIADRGTGGAKAPGHAH